MAQLQHWNQPELGANMYLVVAAGTVKQVVLGALSRTRRSEKLRDLLSTLGPEQAYLALEKAGWRFVDTWHEEDGQLSFWESFT